jgi:uncharacterized protein YajQ (UPF0234 family)
MLLVAEYRGTYGDCWPLSPEMKEVLRVNYVHITAVLRVDAELIQAVVSKGCFKTEQLESVAGTLYEKSSKLLDKFRRSNTRNLNHFIRILRDIQPKVVPLLTGEAGRVQTDNVDFSL